MTSVSLAGSTAERGGAPSASLEALADTLASETRLLSDLGGLLRRQRAAVAADDLPEIEDTVYSTHRILMTLSEARRRRTALVDLLGSTIGAGPLQAEFDLLRSSAGELGREVEISRQILREAMAGNEELIRTIYGTAASGSFYDQAAAPSPSPDSVEGTLLRRRA